MKWSFDKTQPPPREVLADAAADVLHAGAHQVSIVYQRGDNYTTVHVRFGLLTRDSVVTDLELQEAWHPRALWITAAQHAAQRINDKMQQDADQLAASQQGPPVQLTQQSDQLSSSSWFISTASWISSTSWLSTNPNAYIRTDAKLNPKLPKPGDEVRDKFGRVIGLMCADGTIEALDPEVAQAIDAAERKGDTATPHVIRRAIDLSGKLGKK